jgi:ABC-type nitrate/sulfonate/bicarbonate transport system substrate-binding protein
MTEIILERNAAMGRSEIAVTEQRTLNRRESLALMLAGLSASALPAHAADAMEITSFEIGANRDPQLGAQVVIAVEKSFFKAEGLDLKIIWTQQSGDLQPLMAGGSINVATLGMHSIIPMRARRVPLRAVCALCEYSGTQGLVISPGKTLSGPADLVGKRIAVPNQAPHEMALVKLGKQYNFDAKKIILVRMEPSEAVVAAARGDVDGVLTFQPHLYKLLQLGGKLYFTGTTTYFEGAKVDLPLDDRLLYIHSTLAVNEKWATANPNTTAALVKALVRATNFLSEQPAESQKIMQDFFHVDAEALKQAMEQNRYGIAIDPALKKSVEFSNDWLMVNKQITSPIAEADTVLTGVLQKIDPKLVTWNP